MKRKLAPTLIKPCAVLTILLVVVGCGSGTAANPNPSPSQNSCPTCVPATGVLTFTGDVAGTMTLTSASVCSRTPDLKDFELVFIGTGLQTAVPVDAAQSGKAWALVVDASAANPDAVDAGLGPLAYHLSEYLSHATDGYTQSRVSIGQDLRSGSLNLQLKAEKESVNRLGAQVRVTGTFTCSFT
jgi:hypothetical protein